jgi:hypothetical protein
MSCLENTYHWRSRPRSCKLRQRWWQDLGNCQWRTTSTRDRLDSAQVHVVNFVKRAPPTAEAHRGVKGVALPVTASGSRGEGRGLAAGEGGRGGGGTRPPARLVQTSRCASASGHIPCIDVHEVHPRTSVSASAAASPCLAQKSGAGENQHQLQVGSVVHPRLPEVGCSTQSPLATQAR